MATELLERIVIQHFNDNSLNYTIVRDDLVQISLPTPEGYFRLHIVDHEFSEPLIEVIAPDFVRFPPSQETYAATMCNKLNRRSVGKFVLDEHRDVSYHLDCPLGESSSPDDFRRILVFALSSFTRFYPVVMTVRWAQATVEQALERRKDGEPGTPIISDEQLREILFGEDSEDSNPEE